MFRFSVALLMLLATAITALAQTEIVTETFDQYTSDAEFLTVWVPRDGSGNNPASVNDAGILTMDDATFPGVEGQAVDHVGGAINQYEPTSGGPFPGSPVVPTETQSVFLGVDFFDGASGNERMTIGLRNRTGGAANIIEMGLYNSNSCDPTVCSGISPQNATPTTPGFYIASGYATRTQLFAGFESPLLVQPDWQYFQLPVELDRPDDTDEITRVADIGPGWHRYTATITPSSVTYTIDLFRDGVKNLTRDENGVVVGVGDPGVDAQMTFPVNINPVGFDSLRIGGPSGLSSAGTGATGFDNIVLKLIDVLPPGNPGDYNNDGAVDAADYVIWRKFLGTNTQLENEGENVTPGMVTDEDYGVWVANFGAPPAPPGLGLSAVVPEPSAVVLFLMGIVALTKQRRNR